MERIAKVKTLFNTIYPKLLFLFFVVFTLVSPFDRLFPFSLKRVILIFFLFIFFLRFVFHENKNALYYFLFAFLGLVLIMSSLAAESHGRFMENFEDFAYFSCLLICLTIATDKVTMKALSNYFSKYKNLIILIAFFCYASFLIAYLVPGSFDGGSKDGFRGFTKFSHSCATLCLFLVGLLLASKVKNPVPYLPAVVFTYLTKARTFLLLFIPLIFIYFLILFRRKRTAILVMLGLFLFGVSLLLVPAIRDKIMYANGQWYKNHPIDAISSNRSIMWTGLLSVYVSDGPLGIIFGRGFSFVRSVNEVTPEVTHRVWAHNDFIETMMATGILGLIVYLFFLFFYISKSSRNSKAPLLVYFVFAAFLNGMMLYFALSLSMIFLSSIDFDKKNIVHRSNDNYLVLNI